jgi:hypothetical protein
VSLGIPFNPIDLVTSLVSSQQPQSKTTAMSVGATQASGISSTTPFSNLNLTSAESAQISAILKTSQGQPFGQIASSIEHVLTPSQQKTFEGDLQAMQMRGGHHHHGGGGSGSSSTIDSGTDAFGVASIANASSTTTAATAPTTTSSLFSELAAMFSAQSQTQQQGQLLDL